MSRPTENYRRSPQDPDLIVRVFFVVESVNAHDYVIDDGMFELTPDTEKGPQTITAHLFLLEHEEYGDEAACVIVDEDGNLVLEDVYNGFSDLEDAGWAEVGTDGGDEL